MLTRSFLLFACCLTIFRLPAADAAEGTGLAEGPLWPIGLHWPAATIESWNDKKKKPSKPDKADILAWLPEARPLRALLLIPANSDSKHVGEHQPLRAVAEQHGLGIVYFRNLAGSVIERGAGPDASDTTFETMLQLIREAAELPELKEPFYITFGKSSRGNFPFKFAWKYPARTIATISYHAEVPHFPLPDWAAGAEQAQVLHVAINGITEWDGTWYRHVRPGLLNYRAQSAWLPHQVVLQGVGHGNYVDMHGSPGYGLDLAGQAITSRQVWDYIAAFVDDACRLRLPAEGDSLQAIDTATGFLVHPRAIEEVIGSKWFAWRQDDGGRHQAIAWPDEPTPVYDQEQGMVDPALLIRPAAAVPEAERRKYLWLPSEALARRWLRLHDTYGRGLPSLPKKK